MAKKREFHEDEFEKIRLIPEAAEEYKKLDGSIKIEVDKKLAKLDKNPFLGFPLGNKANMDLTGFYKLYACGKSVRIVYRLLTPEKVEIIEVWGIGKRENMEAYKDVDDRKN
ncbi:type II toxin-antitoxin system RelE/ParE family toxin [Treponema sp. Marseille-Q3903]|uniref:type II toxin-antitoxin system RelE family toxin n=1 Tax=Treponema sp. Marseille-Q3903 TaxID=2766703 RepID=UPI0016529B74|nr:addiction module toxin RelE [Treponema sp. Marseille-Q3903]MBC6713921.1 addiction module toxin RelE [Treponema sp. Marseille-Q3903]